jgi:hypothetical protein
MSRVVRVQFKNAEGQPMVGQTVALTGCGERESNPDGFIQFLVDDVPEAILQIGGVNAWSGATGDLKASEVFTQNGTGFVRN